MDGLFGAEGSLIVRFVVAFVIVLALIGATFWVIRRFGATRVGAAAQRGRQPRLAVIDAAPVDGRRRLVLVRRDNVEHLLMIGGPSDIVVEQNIVRAVPVTAPRDVPVPRTGAPEGGPVRTIADRAPPPEDEWTPPEPAPRPSFARPEPLGRPARRTRAEPRPYEPPVRPPLPASIAPLAARPLDPAPSVRSPPPSRRMPRSPAWRSASRPHCAVRTNRDRHRRPFPPPTSRSMRRLPRPRTASRRRKQGPAGTGASGAKSKSVLDSLEEEMASLLGRPPEKQ